MSVDTTYIINQFARQKTLQVQMTNVPDTINVSVTNADAYVEHVSSIDSVISQMAQLLSPVTNEPTCISLIPEQLTAWAIPLIIALIAMSAPLLLTNINGIDSKYHSTRILNTFKQTREFKCFKWILIIIGIGFLIKICSWAYFVSSIIVLVCAGAFLLSIIFLCVLLTRFYDYSELAVYLIKKYNYKRTDKIEKEKIYYALIDCLKYAILQNDKKQTEEILSFFEKDTKNNKYYLVSQPCKDFIIEISELICRENNYQILYLNTDNKYSLPISFLFPDNESMHLGVQVSRESYLVIWETLLLYVIYNRNEFILSYWEIAQNHYNYSITNDYKNDYIILHEKVGAMLLANSKYATLYNIIFWTETLNPYDLSTLFRMRLFNMQEKLISLKPECIMLRYIRLMYAIDHDTQQMQIPHIAATEDMPNPIKEYCVQYMALLYLLSCHKDDKNVYFFYEEGEDLNLPETIDIATIEKQTNDLTKAASELLKNETLRKTFTHLYSLDEVPSLNCFVDAVRENFKIKTRIADILPEVYKYVDATCQSEYKEVFPHYILPKIKNGRGKQKVQTGLSWICLVLKEELNTILPQRPLTEKIKTRIYCSIHESAINIIDKIKTINHVVCSKDQFVDDLIRIITPIKNKEEYILVSNDARGENIFKNSAEYKNSCFMKISVLFLPIQDKSNKCHFWLLEKDKLPYYKIKDDAPIQDIYGYRFKGIAEDNEFHSQRIVLDIGRLTSEVYNKLELNISTKIIPNGKTLNELVIIAGYIPICWYTKRSSTILCKWEVNEIPIYSDYYKDWEDYEEAKEDILSPFIITPEEHNKTSK